MFKKKISRYLPVTFFLIALILILTASVQAVYVRLNESVEFPTTEAETFVRLFDNSTGIVISGGANITDTNASTACGSDQFLSGDGYCIDITSFNLTGAAPYLAEKAIGFGSADDKVVGNYPWFIYKNDSKTLSVQNVTVKKRLAVGSQAFIVRDSIIYAYENFYTDSDNRALTATLNQRAVPTGSSYPATLRFEMNYYGNNSKGYRISGGNGVVRLYGSMDGVRTWVNSIEIKNVSINITSAISTRSVFVMTGKGQGNITVVANYWASNTISNGTVDTLINYGAENTAVTLQGSVRQQVVFYCPAITGVDDPWCIKQLGTSPSLLGGNLIVNANFTVSSPDFFVNSKLGRVGIGTNAPDSILHIKANTPGTVGSHAAGQLIIQDPDDTVFGNVVITAYESDDAGNPDQQLWYLGSSSGSTTDIIFLNRRNSKLQLGTAGAAKMTILGDGNVGIGTTSPTHNLNLIGDFNFTGLIYGNGSKLISLPSGGDGSHNATYEAFNSTTNIQNLLNKVGLNLSYLNVDKVNLSSGYVSILKPFTNAVYDFGTTSFQWLTGFFVNLIVSGDVNLTGNLSIIEGDLRGGVSFVLTYLDMVATATDNIIGLSAWEDDPAAVILIQPVNVRNVQVSGFPDGSPPGNRIKGTVTVDGVDSDGAVVQEIFTFDTNVPETQVGDIQFAIFTSIACDAAGDSGTGLWTAGLADAIGIQNYPLGLGTDIIKVSKNGGYYPSLNYVVDVTYGTITDLAPIQANDYYTIWVRPFA